MRPSVSLFQPVFPMLHDIIFPVSSTTRSSSRRKNGNASESFAVATGSTNFSLGGLYIQNNNVLLFRDADVASFYANVFAAAFPNATGFSAKPIAKQWFEKTLPHAGTYRFCFSPHKKAALSMDPLAEAIEGAKKSVFTPSPSAVRRRGRPMRRWTYSI